MSGLRCRTTLLAALIATLSAGCRPASEISYATPTQWGELSEPLQKKAGEQLIAHCGTYFEPKLIGGSELAQSRLKHGQAVYQLRCAQCHGDNGDGAGPVASQMYPRPRDYRKGMFKFTSTTYGAKPLREDLVRTIHRGVRGTSMPAFNLLPDEDVESVVDYVLSLTHRGELADAMLFVAQSEDELNDELVKEAIDAQVIGKWKSARESVIIPRTPEPELTAERAARGRALFLTSGIGCLKCHGDDGRGRTPENLAGDLKDKWGHATRAADLTSGMLRGGQEPMDVYRRVFGGINGTPMPAFAGAFQDNPDALWDLVAYVKYVTNRRRAGEMPPTGVIKPFIPSKAAASGGE
jgi:mono/diheme cytochrome c family protein